MKSLPPSFSHVNLQRKKGKSKNDWTKPLPLNEVLNSSPKEVDTYDGLVKDVAQLLYRNRHLTLYYRGQNIDYKNERKTIIMPSIFRVIANKSKGTLTQRFDVLNAKAERLKVLFRESEIKYAGTHLLNKYPEIAWSLLQHYEVCDTPLLDITHSLHVACSFAFDRNEGQTGIVYVLGMPWPADAIGYNTYEELVNIRLLSVCPPQAHRPFFQEGYLAGPFPNYHLDDVERIHQFDFGRRLIAKFEIPIDKSFWGSGFGRIPQRKLYQEKDPIKKICDQLRVSK